MLTYCLFCETIKCDLVARSIEQDLGCVAFSPKRVQHTWSAGKMVDIVHDLLPGYVFVYAEREPLDIRRVQATQGVIRCLSTADKQYALSGSDERFALMLLHNKGVIGKTKVYEEGQRIRVCEGVYEGLETRILKVDRQKGRMQIDIPFANRHIRTWVEFEIVEDPK